MGSWHDDIEGAIDHINDLEAENERLQGDAQELHFDWRSYLLGIGTAVALIVVAAIMVSFGD